MAAPAAVVVVMVAIMATLGITWTILYLLARIRAMRDQLAVAREVLDPAIDQLRADTELTRRELRRVQDAADDLRR